MKCLVNILLIAMLAEASNAIADPIFSARIDYRVGPSPTSVFASDLDADGDMDLAIANEGSDDVSILINRGDGTYQPAVNYVAGDGPTSIFASDLDSDGDDDLAATYGGFEGNVSILLNDGDGTFQSAVNYAVGYYPFSVIASDLDSDGDMDLAATNWGPWYSGGVSVLKNNGDGTFQTAIHYAAGDHSHSVYASDLDGDGDSDLAVANWGYYPNVGDVSILKNNGNGTFQAAVHYGAGDSPNSVFASDLDADGDMDLAVANGPWYSDSVSILVNNGNGAFQTAVNYSVGGCPYSIFASDLDADGDMDLAIANEGSDDVSILINNGNGTFRAAVNYEVGSHPQSIFLSDLDGDGDMDLAVANVLSDNVSLLENDGDGTFQAAINYVVGNCPYSVFASDLDDDGDDDLAVANFDYLNSVSILKNNSDGTYQEAVNYALGSGSLSLYASDLDGDGDMDLAVGSDFPGDSDGVSVLMNNGDASFQEAVNYGAGSGPYSIFAADLNRDGVNDLTVVNAYSRDVSVLINNGEGMFQAAVNYAEGGDPCSVFASDLDGDGDNDLAVANCYDVSILINLSPETGIVDFENGPAPYAFSLSQNYPNPFNARTTIQYSLPERSTVTIDIFDILGRKIATLAEGIKPAGDHQVIWDADNQASGMYIYRIEAGDLTETRKMVLLK